MKKTGKNCAILLILLLLVLGMPGRMYAATDLDTTAQQTAEQALENAPESVRSFYEGQEEIELSFSGLWQVLQSELGDMSDTLKTPSAVFAIVLAVCLVYALLSNLGDSRAIQKNVAVRACVCVVCTLCVGTGIIGLIQSTLTAIEAGRTFVLGFVPVFSGILISTGGVNSAAIYGAALIGASTLISETASVIIKPLVGVMAGLSVASGVFDSGFQSLVTALRKTLMWILGISTTLFLGLVKLQSIAAARTDSFAFRTSRFLVSSAIPVIGASANEALSTVGGGLAVIKSTTGIIGVVSVCAIFLPPIIHCVLCGMAMYFASVIGEFTGAAEPSVAVRSIKSCIDILIAVLALYFMIVVVCTAMMMNVGTGQ